jgi:hypothetical protein
MTVILWIPAAPTQRTGVMIILTVLRRKKGPLEREAEASWACLHGARTSKGEISFTRGRVWARQKNISYDIHAMSDQLIPQYYMYHGQMRYWRANKNKFLTANVWDILFKLRKICLKSLDCIIKCMLIQEYARDRENLRILRGYSWAKYWASPKTNTPAGLENSRILSGFLVVYSYIEVSL